MRHGNGSVNGNLVAADGMPGTLRAPSRSASSMAHGPPAVRPDDRGAGLGRSFRRPAKVHCSDDTDRMVNGAIPSLVLSSERISGAIPIGYTRSGLRHPVDESMGGYIKPGDRVVL